MERWWPPRPMMRVFIRKIQNPESECRKKSECRMPKETLRCQPAGANSVRVASGFEFRASFGFRPSDFGFQVKSCYFAAAFATGHAEAWTPNKHTLKRGHQTGTPPSDCAIALQGLQHLAAGVHQFDLHRHLAHGVGGAAQAGVVAADDRLDAVEHAFLEFLRLDVFLCNSLHAAVHRQVVVAGGNT